MASDRKTPRQDPYPHGRVATHGSPDQVEQARERRRGLLITGASDRPFNGIDAMSMGQEDYRDRKPQASRGLFENRADHFRSLRRLGRSDLTDDQLYQAYVKGYRGEGVLS